MKYLAEYGGQTLKETVWRIMKEVMTNQLALKFNWCGTKGKAAFKDLRLSNVLFSKYFVRVILMECRK